MYHGSERESSQTLTYDADNRAATSVNVSSGTSTSPLRKYNKLSTAKLEDMASKKIERMSEIVCWATVGLLALFLIVTILIRGLGVVVSFVWIFFHSGLTMWIVIPAFIAVIAGFLYIRPRRRRIQPNQKFTR